MSNSNGHAEKTRAVKLIEHFKSRGTGTLPSNTFRIILMAMGKVYRNVDHNIVDHPTREVLTVAKEVDGVSERELLEAMITVFGLGIPIVYPDQFNPILILAPDGSELWSRPAPEKKDAPVLPPPAESAESAEP
ncbi:hypothetical protein IT407_02785 [Candidatus Uhrbacteria bacterium]|nr:hypothetical protein [Candidatus Uhrbacteria bacterium]